MVGDLIRYLGPLLIMIPYSGKEMLSKNLKDHQATACPLRQV